MNEMLDMLGHWQLDVKQVRERVYRTATPRERWHAVWLRAGGRGARARPAGHRRVENRLLEVTDIGEHGKNGFDDHTHVPFAVLTEVHAGGMPLLLGKASIREDDHLVPKLVYQILKGRAIIDIGGVTIPVNDAPQVVEHEDEAELAPTIQR